MIPGELLEAFSKKAVSRSFAAIQTSVLKTSRMILPPILIRP
jgi:hypothetical protein